ncbi:MAG: tetratricopeptide repeat protein [Lachnospiraceae bacterium]|nr:tetratricopeptide repeat protein [Lachnospiraceae bacterium]
MDKYEFNIKVEKMKKAVDRKDYTTAARLADSLGWERSTNAKVLMMIAQIYEKLERYADARNALTAVYNRVPVGKRIVYKLAELAVKCDDVEEALDLYREYQEIAPNDPTKLILAYKISTARGDDLEKRISILEAYRRRDFDEKWAYELATLYQQAGKGSECVALCDEIILWFGVGPYVDRAMTLKVAYEPLTPEQEERRANRDYYEQKLAEVAAASMQVSQTIAPADAFADAVSEHKPSDDENEEASASPQDAAGFPTNAPDVSPVVKEADLHLTMQQELAQAIQSTSDDLNSETTTNEWITDKPLSVDRVGEDIDGQYTLFRTASEEIGEPHVPEHTRTFSFGALLTKTRRLDSLRDLAELNNSRLAEKEQNAYDELTEAFEAAVAEEASSEISTEPVVDTTVTESVTAPAEDENTVAESVASPAEDESVVAVAVASPAEDESAVAVAVASPVEDESAVAVAVASPAEDESAAAVAVASPAEDESTAAVAVASPAEDESAVAVAVASPVENDSAEPSADAVTEAITPEVPSKPQHMIFCHVLKLNDETPTIAQIKESIRQAHEVSGIPAASIARIGVDKINRAGFSAVLAKLEGRDLLLEHAGELTQRAIDQLISAVDEPPCTTVILLADDAAGVAELYQKAPALFPLSANETVEEEEISFDLDGFLKAEATIAADEAGGDSDTPESAFEASSLSENIPQANPSKELSPDEFTRFIIEYALENDCKFDSMAELALAAHIDRMELNRESLTRDAAIELADDIIDRADHWTLKCLFVSRYDKEGYLIIKESHIH